MQNLTLHLWMYIAGFLSDHDVLNFCDAKYNSNKYIIRILFKDRLHIVVPSAVSKRVGLPRLVASKALKIL